MEFRWPGEMFVVLWSNGAYLSLQKEINTSIGFGGVALSQPAVGFQLLLKRCQACFNSIHIGS